ncbi:alpha/beta fold hydrolase [Streptococcus oricebi]|uniref:Alpha/beta hydrolase n=1 Tax=Streptococcus oricebi TaxID=1547447 RepID=A0ABS5B2V8_9STRE|nr:alpha/beta hydrolase [Streptococcus oricebi]MBP2623176.1 alpha/beta hydrolase [Streptococcus oricebi]
MKLIFLQGAGQTADDWGAVREYLANYPSAAPELLPNGVFPADFAQLKANALEYLKQENEDFILVGLSLGGTLALALAKEKLPRLKGLVVSAAQYDLKHNFFYKLQNVVFKLLPSKALAQKGVDKASLLQFFKSMKNLEMTEQMKHINLAVRVICGSKDKVNLATTRNLARLLPCAQLTILENGGHELNKERPEEFSTILEEFLQKQLKAE